MSNYLDTFDEKDCRFKMGRLVPFSGSWDMTPAQVLGTHLPTGIKAIGTGKRTQHKNKLDCIWKIMLKLEELDDKNDNQ